MYNDLFNYLIFFYVSGVKALLIAITRIILIRVINQIVTKSLTINHSLNKLKRKSAHS